MSDEEVPLLAAVVELLFAVMQLALVCTGYVLVAFALVLYAIEVITGLDLPAEQLSIVGGALAVSSRVLGWMAPHLQRRIVERLTR